MLVAERVNMERADDSRTGASPRTKAEQVAELIRRQICDTGFGPGDKLPTEQEWADRAGVSRLIVREAIGRLRGLGLVESKPRVGMRVSEAAPFDGLQYWLPQIVSTKAGDAGTPGDRRCPGVERRGGGGAPSRQAHRRLGDDRAGERRLNVYAGWVFEAWGERAKGGDTRR